MARHTATMKAVKMRKPGQNLGMAILLLLIIIIFPKWKPVIVYQGGVVGSILHYDKVDIFGLKLSHLPHLLEGSLFG
jgi:hypothetical protein